jgi:acetoin utilization deacetylase AcuC-like enzyme
MVQLYYPDVPATPVPSGHRFPAGKYAMLRAAVDSDPLLVACCLQASPIATPGELLHAHGEDYIAAMCEGRVPSDAMRRIGLPWSEILVRRSMTTVGGSLAAARTALREGISGQLAGGTHHAHRDFGSGYCVFNDLAVASLVMLAAGQVRRVAILDLDVHQGDGNAAILTGNPGMLVVSLHGEKNFPFRKVASDIDVGLPDGTSDGAYLAALADVLPAIDRFRPDIMLYLSGADALACDKLGRLALTHQGLMERDRMVFEFCRRRGLPVSIAIGGGYADPISASVEGYANTFRAAVEIFAP